MKIAVVNDVLSVTGERTLWHVLTEELHAIPVEFGKGQTIPEDVDLVITNSMWGKFTNKPYISIVQDCYITMEMLWGGYLSNVLTQIESLVNAKVRVATSNYLERVYKRVCGNCEMIMVGVDPNLFRPLDRKVELREKYGIPKDAKVNIWVGSHHPVKGLDVLDATKDFWIFVFKDALSANLPPNSVQFAKVPPEQLVELYNCADEFVSTSRVEGGGLVVSEAMFCGLPVRAHRIGNRAGILWDWYPENKNPRQEAFDKGLDNDTMIKKWKLLVDKTLESI